MRGGGGAARRAAALALATALLATACGADRDAAAPRPPTLLALTAGAAGPGREVATAFVSGDGRAVTVAHAVAGQRPVVVAGRRAGVLRTDARFDLAVLRVPDVRAPAVRTARARAGQRVRVSVLRDGEPRLLPATVRRTITARIGRHTRPALELDATVLRGDSGAPVLDEQGRVVGVVFAQSATGPDRAYAVESLRNLR